MVPPRLYLLLCVALCSTAFGQSRKIDSLKKELSATEDPIEQSQINVTLANTLHDYSLQESLAYSLAGLEAARVQNDSSTVALALTAIGNYYFLSGKNELSEKFYRQAIRATSNSPKKHDEPLLQLSNLFRERAMYDSARKYIERAARLSGENYAVLMQRASVAADLSQNEKALQLLKTSLNLIGTTDTLSAVKAMITLSSVYTALARYDSADLYNAKTEELLKQEPNTHAYILFYINRGQTSFVKGEFNNAIDDYNRALDKLKLNSLARPYANLLYLVGEVYGNQGAYQTAFEYLFNALHEFESLEAPRRIARANTQIGWAYNFQQNYSEALVYAAKSLEICTALNDSSSIAQTKNMQGYALLKSGRLNEALLNFDEALRIRKRIKNYWGVSYTLYNTSLVYLELGQRSKAMSLLNESLKTDKEIGNRSGYVFTCNQLGKLYAEDGKFSMAEHYLNEANLLAKQIPLPTQLLANYQNFIALSERQRDSRKTIYYYKRYASLSDSLNNAVNSSRIAKADALFQLQKKTNEIKLINAESVLKQQLIHVQQSEIEFQKTIIYAIVSGILVLLALFFFIYRLLRANIRAKKILSRQNRNISEQKEEIQAQAEELTESNHRLIDLNSELEEKNFEIESQSEKIKETNNSLELRVDERTRQLQNALQELEIFFYRTSHDFRRPLTTYLGLVEIANASVKDEQALYIFNKVKENTLALDGMLTKLQSISNIDYDNECDIIMLPKLISECLDRFKPMLSSKAINISNDLAVEEFHSNPHLLQVILVNILENAVTFTTPLVPTIKIQSRIAHNFVQISIEDNGQGISPDISHRIFEMYFRGTDTSTGNGLGLYIAKRAVEKLGGSITFLSNKNEGAIFTVSIPRSK